MKDDDFDKLLGSLDQVQVTKVSGRITSTVGMLIKAIIPRVKIGELCWIKREGLDPLPAEVVGFTQEEVFLSPLGEMTNVGPSCEVTSSGMPLNIKVGPGLLGRVLDGMGNPIDTATKGPLTDCDQAYSVMQRPPDPLTRMRIHEPLSVGVRCIDGCLTVGKGQRVGIFAAAGGGKSTMMGMIARNASADINVIALIGERGRELRDFIEESLGEEGMKKSVVIVSTSDQPSQVRLNAAYVGTAIAEYFRDQGKSVILMMDSVTRFARALREVGLAAGEPPARAGYTPSVFSTLPKLLERSGNSDKGSITAFYTVLVAGDDMNEPVADEVRSILDGHIILSAELAAAYHYPAVSILPSASRVIREITTKEHLELIGKLKKVLASYQKNELLIKIGEYKKGADRDVDFAIDHIDKVNRFLKQGTHEKSTFEETMNALRSVFR